MKRTIAWGLVALAAACSSEDADEALAYGAPGEATVEEQAAATNAQYTLSQSVGYDQPTDPALGAPGLVDQLVAELGGEPGMVAQAPMAKALAGARAIAPVDPCITATETSVTWTGCAESDAGLSFTIDGTIQWNATTGRTDWTLHQTFEMALGPDMEMSGAVDWSGSMVATDSTIAVDAESRTRTSTLLAGMRVEQGFVNTLVADLDYVDADVFCITGGTLTVEQRWTERPAGVPTADMPDRGWRFDWTGCGGLTVAHGG